MDRILRDSGWIACALVIVLAGLGWWQARSGARARFAAWERQSYASTADLVLAGARNLGLNQRVKPVIDPALTAVDIGESAEQLHRLVVAESQRGDAQTPNTTWWQHLNELSNYLSYAAVVISDPRDRQQVPGDTKAARRYVLTMAKMILSRGNHLSGWPGWSGVLKLMYRNIPTKNSLVIGVFSVP